MEEKKFRIALNDVRIEKGLTWYDLEEKTEIPLRTLLSIQRNQSTTFKTMLKLCEKLHIDIIDLIRR